MGGGNPLKKVEGGIRDAGSSISAEFKRNPAVYGGLLGGPMGASAGSAMGGKGDVGESAGANDLSTAALDLLAQTDPLRRSLIGRSEDFLAGNLDVTQSPMYAGLKQSAENQYGTARKNILATTPTGGALTSALTGLEGSRANMMTQGTSDIANQELARAMGLATGTPLTAAFGGLGTAGSIQSQMAMAQAQQNAAEKQAMGQGMGTLAIAAGM